MCGHYSFVTQQERSERDAFRGRENEVLEDAPHRLFHPHRQLLTGLRMFIVTEAKKLLFFGVPAQAESLRCSTEPLASDALTSRVVITGLQMLTKVLAGIGKILLCLMCQH